ncbi:MAG: alpha/beta hydrolase, partial [Gammaproteobacteria bacterium]
IHYRDEGSSALPALVLLHGANGSLFNFDRLSPLLKDDFRIITIDLPAFGLTGAVPSSDYSIKSSFRVIDSVLEHLNIESLILGGNSMGGGISWRYAIENPKRLKGLVLLSSSGIPGERAKRGSSRRSADTPLVWKLMRSPLATDILSIYTPKFFATQGLKASVYDSNMATTEWANQFHELTLLEGSRTAILSRMSSGYVRNQKPELLKDLEIPALLIHGNEDNIIPVSSSEKLVTFFQ